MYYLINAGYCPPIQCVGTKGDCSLVALQSDGATYSVETDGDFYQLIEANRGKRSETAYYVTDYGQGADKALDTLAADYFDSVQYGAPLFGEWSIESDDPNNPDGKSAYAVYCHNDPWEPSDYTFSFDPSDGSDALDALKAVFVLAYTPTPLPADWTAERIGRIIVDGWTVAASDEIKADREALDAFGCLYVL